MTVAAVIDVQGLTRRFGPLTAVDHVDFQVEKGELFGFLGPNGAGKTTTVRMLTGVIEPSEGTASIGGHDVRLEPVLSRAHLAVVPEQANVYLDLSVRRNVMLMAQLHGVARRQRIRESERLLELTGLADRGRHKARTLSKGLRQRLMLCAALVTDPEILFLDEPTAGLDVKSARLIRRVVRDMNSDGLTVFLTTHNMEEAEEMCSRVAIINHGRIAAVDSPSRLRTRVESSRYVEVVFADEAGSVANLAAIEGVRQVSTEGRFRRLYTDNPARVAAGLNNFAAQKGVELTHVCTREPSHEDRFIELTRAGPGEGT